ncbi:MAG: hydroxymethylbilane synthase [Planctomycetota bacterium]|nr:hydroxymethylbilane synthase [Planctomycetota bacterium]
MLTLRKVTTMNDEQSVTKSLRLGTRSSQLATWQSNWVATQLRAHGYEIEIIQISTSGDVLDGPIGAIGSQGVFTKEIQRSLMANEVDFAVHSLKDLPTDDVEGLCLACVPLRETIGDVLVSSSECSLHDLPPNACIGTGSMRRAAQILSQRPDIAVRDIRGNVDTRLRKLDEGQYDAIVLAEAGLKRLELFDRISHVIPTEIMIPAVGQGALGIECRREDSHVRSVLDLLCDDRSFIAVTAERTMLQALRAGCLAPVAAWGRFENNVLVLTAVVLNADGTQRCDVEQRCELLTEQLDSQLSQAASLGQGVAEELIGLGAEEMIAQARGA